MRLLTDFELISKEYPMNNTIQLNAKSVVSTKNDEGLNMSPKELEKQLKGVHLLKLFISFRLNVQMYRNDWNYQTYFLTKNIRVTDNFTKKKKYRGAKILAY